MVKWILKIIEDNFHYFTQTLCLAKAELRRSHMSSDLGIFWAVMKPLMYIVMFYFAISLGFKSAKAIDGTHCPYFIWLASGIVQWQFIGDLLVGGASCFQKRRTIIRGMDYPLTTMPMVSVMAHIPVYLLMICIVIVLALFLGVRPSVYWLQLPVYIILAVLFLYIWVMMTALMNIMSADILEFLKTIKTAFFWLSGILFNIHGRKSPFFTFNPISYLAEGFRNCFAYHIWIWDQKRLFLHFVIVMFIMTLVAYLLYRKMEKKLPELI